QNGMCVVPCGGAGQACCEGNACTLGGCCLPSPMGNNRTCVAPGAMCLGQSACNMGSCGNCGGPGQPCCGGAAGGNGYCTAGFTVCRGGGGQRSCIACGMAGLPCCENDFCAQGLNCNNALCR